MKKQFTKKLFALLGALLFLGVGAASAANPRDVYLTGTMCNPEWSKNDSNWKLKCVDTNDSYNHFTGTFEIPSGSYSFKVYITDNGYGSEQHNANGGTYPASNQTLKYGDGDNMTLDLSKKGDGTYTIYIDYYQEYSYNPRLSITEVSFVPSIPSVYAWGTFQGNYWESGIPLTFSKNNYSGEIEISGANGIGYFFFSSNGSNKDNGDWRGATSMDLPVEVNDEDTDKLTNTLELKANQNSFKVPNGKYSIEVNEDRSQCKLKLIELKYPDYIYMVGDLKSSNWAVLDPYKAQRSETNEGIVYEFKGVSIYGHNDNRNDKPNDPEEPEDWNYFAFFYNLDSNYDKMLPRLGAAKGNNVDGNNHVFLNKAEGGSTANATLRTKNYASAEEYNFRIGKGYYDVTVNLSDFTVKIKPEEPIVFDWFNGSGNSLKDTDFKSDKNTDYNHRDDIDDLYGEYNVTYSPEGRRVQVGVGDDASHDAANKATFKVWKKSTGLKSKGLVTTLAESDTPEGYSDAEKGIHYDVTDDNIVVLKEAGEYKIQASLTGTMAQVYRTNATSNLDVKVNPMIVAVEQVATQEAPFNFSGGTTFEQILNFDQDLSYGTDFTITVVPNNDAKGWASVSDNVTMQAALTAAEESLWTTYEAWNTEDIDGFYSSVGGTSVKASDENASGYYTYDVTVNVPCSGLYKMTLNPGNNYTFEEGTQTEFNLSVYPNLYGSFNVTEKGKDYTQKAFDLNGYTPVTERDINIPTNETNLENAKFYTPGIYFAESFSVSTTKPASVNTLAEESETTAIGYNYSKAPYVTTADISKVASGSDIYATISKNGASHTFYFTINKTTEGWGVSTGVEAIHTEDGEAVYYNLQGVRVDNPDRGIYVKVVNGKAVKVLRN